MATTHPAKRIELGHVEPRGGRPGEEAVHHLQELLQIGRGAVAAGEGHKAKAVS